jgi:FKBP-type peptidyl-prolyl cis-trans isomerase
MDMNRYNYLNAMIIFLKRYFEAITLTLLSLVLLLGCANDDDADKRKEEQKLIQSYLAANGISANTKTDGGIYYVEDATGTGISPVTGDYIIINYVGRYLDDGSIHETNYDSLKSEWEAAAYYTNFLYGPTKMIYGHSCPGLNEGVGLMKEGGKSRIIIPSEKAYYGWRPLVYEIELLKVIPDPIEYEDSIMKAYFEQNSIDTVKAYYKKVYYLETGADPVDTTTFNSGDSIYFRFTGRLLEGYGSKVIADRIFDTNVDDAIPAQFYFGKTVLSKGNMLNGNKLPLGLKNALDTMRTGVHATVIIPYTQAFAAAGLTESTYGYVEVPPYQSVIYDVHVEKIVHPVKK